MNNLFNKKDIFYSISIEKIEKICIAIFVTFTFLGFTQSLYFIKFGPLIFISFLYGFKVPISLIKILFFVFITTIVIQDRYVDINFDYIFNGIIFPFVLASCAYTLSKKGIFDIRLIANIFIVITFLFIFLQIFVPNVGFWFHGNIFENDFISRTKVISGLSSSSFYMSTYMSMLLPVVVFTNSTGYIKIWPLLLMISIASGSRALVLGMFSSFIKSNKYRFSISLIPIILILVLPVASFFIYVPMLRAYDYERFNIYLASLESIFDMPLGCSSFLYFEEKFGVRHPPHNFVLNLLVIYGVDFILVWIIFYRQLVGLPYLYRVAIVGAFIGALYHNMAPFYKNWPFWIIYGAGLALQRRA